MRYTHSDESHVFFIHVSALFNRHFNYPTGYYLVSVLQLQTHEHMPDATRDGLDDPRAHGPRRSTEGLDGRAIRRANML